jgi:outer membrane protein assembly factor BamB
MLCRSHLRALLFVAVLAASSPAPLTAQIPGSSPTRANTTVHLHWGPRPGVSRYRLQLSLDREFRDTVFDRVVTGTEIAIDDLAPGRYYWRIAALTAKLGEFSSPTPIAVAAQPVTIRPTPTPAVTNPKLPAHNIATSGGWRTAVGNISRPMLAHLVAPDRLDILGTNAQGVTFALEASTGLALWSVRRPVQSRSGSVVVPPLAILSRATRLDNVVIFAGNQVYTLEGSSGRELWQAAVPTPPSSALVINDPSGSQIVVLDNTLQGLTVLSAADGRIVSQTKLPARVVGTVSTAEQNAFAVAYENGDIEIRNKGGSVIRSGSLGNTATTGPLFISGSRGELILAGTRDGLTAMTSSDLRPLGRVALKDDSPRGLLASADFEGDGASEVLMMTARRHLVAVSAADGRILWDVAADADIEALAFADINGDGVLDVFLAAGQAFAVALSGRDGSVIWKDVMGGGLSANHASGTGSRTLLAVPSPSGVMLIGSEPSLTELRAISFPKVANRRNPR